MRVFSRLLSYVKPYLRHLLPAAIFLLLAALLKPAMLEVIKRIIDGVGEGKEMAGVNLKFLLLVAIFTFSALLFYGQIYLMSSAGQRVIIDLRNEIYAHLQFLSLSYFEKRKTGQIMSRVTNDVGVLQTLVTSGLIELVSAILTIIALTIYIFLLDWRLALVTLLGLPLIGLSFGKFSQKIRKVSALVQAKIADITDILQETLSAVKIVKSFSRQDYEIKRFTKKNIESFRATMKGVRLGATLTPLVQWIGFLGLALALWVGCLDIIKGDLTTGGLMAFMLAVGMLGQPINSLTRVNTLIQQSLVCAERVFEILDTKSEVEEDPQAIDIPEIKGEVKFHDVSFSYGTKEKEVLKEINLQANPGEIIALVGRSGAGKTTIANLIPRFYDPVSGLVLIDGIDIRKVKVDSLREQLGIVPQETILFGGSIRENIAYGKLEASNEEIIQAAKFANAHDFIMSLPEGYNTIVGERGVRLSGGQRQRISIARAILKNPRILILDEATSSLDSTSESLVQEALERLMQGRTTFVIAHRLSTIKGADKIVVVEEGRIKEVGVHEELFKEGGLYYGLYKKEEGMSKVG